MLENLRRKFSNPSIKDFYDRCLEWGKFEDLIYYEGMLYSISAERGMKKTSDRSFRPFHKSSKDLSLNWVHMKMIFCPRGTFEMGHVTRNDNPPRQETIERIFLLGETEITQELYEAVMGTNPSEFKKNPKNPVENVTLFDAILFCNKLSELQGLDKCYILTNISRIDKDGVEQESIMSAKVICDFNKNGYRLPTEKEWEYAAKAGTQNKWAGTNNAGDLDDFAIYEDTSRIDGKKQTHPVKSKLPNEWGFYDMSGNVEEWCWDLYNPRDRHAPDARVARGGCWADSASLLHSVARYSRSPNYRYDGNLGFRVCRTLV